jgi:PAS domain S-box-containing protein
LTDRHAAPAEPPRRAWPRSERLAAWLGDAGPAAAAVVAVLLLALSGWLAHAELEQARSIDRLGDQARSVRIGVGRLLSAVTDAETGQRGYLLTLDPAYLQPYEAAHAKLSLAFSDLRAIRRMRGEGARRLDAIQSLTAAKMAELAQTIALAETGRLPAAIAIVRTGRGRAIMDELRARLDALRTSANADPRRRPDRSDGPAAAVVGLGILASLLLAGVALSQRRARRAIGANLASLERFTRAFDMSQGMVCAMDGRITFWAAGMERLYGYTALEAVGRTAQDLLDTRFTLPLRQIKTALMRDGQWQGELTHRRRDGALIEVTSHCALLRDPDGEATGIIKVNNDISDARRAQREGEATSELLAAIVASSDDAILSKTVEGVVTSWNGGAERLFGWTAAEAIGRHIGFIIPPERLAEEEAIIASILAGATIAHYEAVRIAKDGRRVEISASISPIHDKVGHIIGAAKVARDIASQKRMEVERAQYVQALERSNKDLDDFAYIASHDLKEPLRGLFNNARFLQEDYADKLDSEGVRRLQRLGYLCQRMELLVNDLLYFSRLGRQDLAMQPTDVNAVIREIELMTETLLQEGAAVIVIPSALSLIWCDKVRITEVFRNLITNAVKYNDRPSKRIEIGYLEKVKTMTGVERQVFYVKDDGIGIAEEFHEDIFRIFKRLNAEEDDKKGSGVGLTFVRKIIERHGGRIWIDSAPGAGATFYFTMGQGDAYEAAA